MGAEAVVLSFLYSLLMSMGLIGGSYQDIANAFPDNTAQENQILYSVANDPTQNTGGFLMDYLTDPNMIALTNPQLSYVLNNPSVVDDFNTLMQDLGFAIVDNNVQFAIDNGYSVNGVEWTGTMSNGVDTAIVSFVGTSQSAFRTYDNIPDNVGFNAGFGGVNYGKAVWRWSYGDTVIYSTALGTDLNASIGLSSSYVNPHFEVSANGTLQFVYDYLSHSDGWQKTYTSFPISAWIAQGIAIDDAATFEPTESVAAGEEYLSFGTEDNPVVGVSYDAATGVTTYTYKDGTTSTAPPVAMTDTISLSPAVTKPMTQYIINEGDVTNIFNPDAAIPSEAVPFDFTSLGELLKNTFIPTVAFPYQTIYNRLLNKATFLTVITDLGVKLKSITPKRPEYFIYGVDMFGWIDTIGADNFVKVKNLIAFALKVSMLLGSIALVMKTFHVNVGKGSES